MLTACSPFAGETQQETFCNITQIKMDYPDDLFEEINPLAKDFISKLLVKKPRYDRFYDIDTGSFKSHNQQTLTPQNSLLYVISKSKTLSSVSFFIFSA